MLKILLMIPQYKTIERTHEKKALFKHAAVCYGQAAAANALPASCFLRC